MDGGAGGVTWKVRYFEHPAMGRVYQDLRRRDPEPGELDAGPVARAFAAGRAGRPVVACWRGRYAYAAWAAGHDLWRLAETEPDRTARRAEAGWAHQQKKRIAYAGRERVQSDYQQPEEGRQP